MNLLDPTQWTETVGWLKLMGVFAGTCVLVAVKIAGRRWEDWLEEPVGRRDADGGVPFERRWRTRI